MSDAKFLSPVLLCYDALTMGVRGLWNVRQFLARVSFDKLTFLMGMQLVSPAAQERSFDRLLINEGFACNRHRLRTIVVGIDAA